MPDPVPHTAFPFRAALRGRCPRCGQGCLFAGTLALGKQCDVCGLDLERFDQGDGPAAFAILIVGTPIVAGVVILELMFQAPYWLQALIWLPATVILTLVTIRVLKAWLVSEQYRHDASEGRLSE